MIISHNLDKFPNGQNSDYYYGELSELSEYELQDLEEKGIDEVWYWYATAPYEGIGQLLLRKGDLYDFHDAGHCSCYGPTEHVEFRGVPFEQLTEGFTKDRQAEVAILIETADPANKAWRL